jgi:plasmid stabilization system protein ParE
MKRLAVTPQAGIELADAITAYEATRPGHGLAFIEEFDRSTDHLRRFPEMAPEIEPGFRRAVVHRFPFCVVYRVTGDQVQVLGVLPTRADPARLLERLMSAAVQ